MTVFVEEEEDSSVAISQDKGGRIRIERKDPTGGVAMWFDRDVARTIAMVIMGMTQIDREKQ